MPTWYGFAEDEGEQDVKSESIVAVVQEIEGIVSDEVAEYSAPTPEPPTTPGRPDCGGCDQYSRGWCILFPEKWVNASLLVSCPKVPTQRPPKTVFAFRCRGCRHYDMDHGIHWCEQPTGWFNIQRLFGCPGRVAA